MLDLKTLASCKRIDKNQSAQCLARTMRHWKLTACNLPSVYRTHIGHNPKNFNASIRVYLPG